MWSKHVLCAWGFKTQYFQKHVQWDNWGSLKYITPSVSFYKVRFTKQRNKKILPSLWSILFIRGQKYSAFPLVNFFVSLILFLFCKFDPQFIICTGKKQTAILCRAPWLEHKYRKIPPPRPRLGGMVANTIPTINCVYEIYCLFI